jgi:hypothetical protein
MNVSNKVEHNVPPNSPGAVYIQLCAPSQETEWLTDKHLRSWVAEGPEPRHNDTVNEGRSNLNVVPKRKLMSLSVKPQERGEIKDSPDKESDYVKMHLTGAIDYEHLNTDVNDKNVSSNSPVT